MIKAAEKVEFEDDIQIELIMELVQQVNETESIIKEIDSLRNQRETKVQNFEEEKHQSES